MNREQYGNIMEVSMTELKKAALFFDIDGTIESDITKGIPESAITGLRKARENGYAIFINTGRTLCSITPSLHEIGFDGLLCGCGTYITYHDQVLFESELSEEKGYEYVDKALECGLAILLEGKEDIYLPKEITPFEGIEDIRRRRAPWGVGVTTWVEDRNYRYDKLVICTDEHSNKEPFLDAVRGDLDIIDRFGGMYECVQKGYSKATAIEVIREYLGLSREQIYVFGDSSNDMDMFRYTKHAIAMGRHDEVLEPYTEYITDTVENDGLYKALEHYGFI
jgi:hypothetical protein